MAAQENKISRFKAGDTVRVHVRIVEGESERVQVFEGVVLRRRGRGVSETFTVRKISFGVGVERVFPIQSPRIAKVEIARAGKARRARLYYLRKLSGKAARLAEDKKGATLESEFLEETVSESASKPETNEEKSSKKAEAASV